MAIIAAKRQEVAANRYAVFSGRRFCDAVWLKTVKSGDPKPKNKTVATEKRVAAAIEQIPLKATAHCQRLAGATAPGNVVRDLCYVS